MSELKLCILFITLIAFVTLLLCAKTTNVYLLVFLAFCVGMFSESALNKIDNKQQNELVKGE